MRNLTQLFIRTFGKWGFAIFTVYFAICFAIAFQLLPVQLFESLAYMVGPYYKSLRIISYFIHFVICIVAFHFVTRILFGQLYIVRRKTLAFIVAAIFIQLFSFLCTVYIEPILLADKLFKHQVENVPNGGGLFWMEWIAIIASGYLLPFYIGALKLVQFNADMLIAPSKRKK